MKFIQKFLLTACWVGWLPVAPGTWGSLFGAGLMTLAVFHIDPEYCSSFPFFVAIAVCFFIGVFASKAVESEWGEDPSQTVIDEVVGVWLTFVFVPFSTSFEWDYLIIGIILFRLLDIYKPMAIRKMEYAGSGWGVMLDDVLAGIYANVILNLYIWGKLWYLATI